MTEQSRCVSKASARSISPHASSLRSALLATIAATGAVSGACKRTATPGSASVPAPAEAIETPAQPLLAKSLPSAKGDLDQITARGVLRVLVAPAGESFLPRQGMPNCHDRALAEQLAARLQLRVQFAAVDSHDQLISQLIAGKGDLVAAQLTITDRREETVAFTRPVATVSEWLVTSRHAKHKPKSVAELEDLARQPDGALAVHVRPSSSFADTLAALTAQKPHVVEVTPVDERIDTETIVYQVSQGERPATVVDSNTLEAIEAYNPDVERLFTIATGRRIAWATRREDARLRAAASAFLVETALTQHTQERFAGDLAGVKKRGVLRVLTRNNPVTYFLHRGQQMGFDYELSKMLADSLGLRLEMVVPPSRDQLVPWLHEGRGDVIAASLTVTPERSKQVAFSRPYLFADEVVVQRAGDPKPVRTLSDLRGRSVHVRKSSSYFKTLQRLQASHGPFEIVVAPEELETEQLIGQTGSGDIDLTVADTHIVRVELGYRDDIVEAVKLTMPAPEGDAAKDATSHQNKAIAFAVRPSSTELLAAIDTFVGREYRGLRYNMARNRYFKNRRRISAARATRTGVSGRLSPYDGLLKRYAARYDLDWRLMAAQAYQESRFDPTAKSWVGALGLFQVMPATGRELGFDDLTDPEQSTHAGTKYVHQLIRRFDSSMPLRQRVRFALASYNAGFGHVLDAQRLAERQGLDPTRWFGNVEKTIRLLERPEHYERARYGYCRGSEPAAYVSDIQNRYDNYVKVVKN